PAAIDLLGGLLPGGWPELRRRNRDLVLAGRDLLLAGLGTAAPVPDEMIGSMAAVPLHDGGDAAVIRTRLADRGLEVPVTSLPGSEQLWLRISAQAYNSLADYARLVEAVSAIQ
ncbi:MAG: aminotransferase, partial [Actinobacteria bacterium]|nr:aminotransferase [Actinomycetota bacterium]NIS34876.1 aminotransferase [Actinomycetota bacterium]NIU66196.1 aminotransferase [Actinomycetota bacterium]NIW28001.1 aminotransferase [Actinomycetota bacterium]